MIIHKNWVINVTLSAVIVATCLVGDKKLHAINERQIVRAIFDNVTHGLVGLFTCAIAFMDNWDKMYMALICMVISSAIDLDHFIAAKSFRLSVLGQTIMGRRKSLKNQEEPTNYTDDELKDLRTAFDLLDRDQDGMVTPTELQFMLNNLGIHVSDELIDGLMKEASKTGNGLIDETEFLQWISRIQALRESPGATAEDDDLTQDLVAAFRVFDRDNNGYITRDELQRAMQMIGENVTDTQLNDMLALADLDKDGRINYEEFARLLL